MKQEQHSIRRSSSHRIASRMNPPLTDEQLTASCVVANCRMNRERELTGGNGYQRELGLHPLDFLRSRRPPVRWLDLCCGTGRALLQADALLEAHEDVRVVGVDLHAMFWPGEHSSRLCLIAASLHAWNPDGPFDLITCVHGLHYLGGKFGVVTRAASWLTDDGVFVANLDAANLRDDNGEPLGRLATRLLREAGLEYDTRRHRLTCRGRKSLDLPLDYVGADDTAGPNYTGQPAVHSLYRVRQGVRK
jgi:SAM-dependent methyltransferase